jgi:GNAT superfamily N-acetyltransferase
MHGGVYICNMKLTIRQGGKKDLPAILSLIKELANYENALEEVTITLEDLEKDGFENHPWYRFLVAEKDNQIIGLSFYWIRYSTWKGKFLFLEDFVIKKEYRRHGIGSQLFEKTINVCKELKLNGMIWQVLDWNTPAIDFYKKYNANISSTWLNGKLTKKQINEICSDL